MKNLIGCALMPHPPIMIPEVGKEELIKITHTVKAMQEVSTAIKAQNPQTIVIMTPHGPAFEDAVGISVYPRLRGDLANFGAPEVSVAFETDVLLVEHILKKADRLGLNLVELTEDTIKSYRFDKLQLDHGALVPLYYLHKAGFKGQIVHMSVGMLSYEEMYTLGKAVQSAIGMVDKKVAVIASGDLSHRLTPEAPNGFSPQGQIFDQEIVAALKNIDIKAILNMDRKLIAEAGECGLRPITFLMGVLGGLRAQAQIVSYEGPFGVGYCVAAFTIQQGE